MQSLIKKITATFLALGVIVTVVGCNNITISKPDRSRTDSSTTQAVDSFTKSDQTDSQTNSQTNSQSSDQTSNSASEAQNNSTSIHTHDYTLKVIDEKYEISAPTLLDSGKYYYSCSCSQASGEKTFEVEPLDYDYSGIDKYINRLITTGGYNNPIWNTEDPYSTDWNYIDGCFMISLLKMYYLTGEEKYFNFVRDYISPQIKNDGKIDYYKESEYNLDNINEGRVLFDLYERTSDEKYRKAIDTLYSQIQHQPRTSLGSFWHKQKYTDQVWLDGLYMAQVFYTLYQQKYSDGDYSDIMKQFRNVETYMKDKQTGLYYHGFDNTKKQSWADKETGLSQSFWLRAIGWYTAALSDVSTLLPEGSAEKAEMSGYLKGAVDSILKYLDPDKKMFYQVVDKAGLTAIKNGKTRTNYLETSGTALICYAILNAVNCGVLDESYYNVGKSIFNGICCEYLSGTTGLSLGGICKVAGLGGTSNGIARDGTFYYYLSEKIVSDEAKGVAPFIMSYIEITKHNKNNAK